MTEGDGMSVSEFLYPLFQGWDFWHMYNKLGIQMQIGGSDQYGNIITGIDVVKTVRETEEAPHFKMPSGWEHEPLGFTVPLITDGAGNKLGKSAGNAIWCDPFKTSPFEFYGYFMRRTDEEVESWLKMFTFMPLKQIEGIMAEHKLDPAKRVAQHYLAFEVSSLVHGSERALQEAQQHSFRFGGKLPEVFLEPTEESGIISPNTAPRSDMQLPRSVLNLSPARILRAVGFAKSSSEAHEIVKKQGAYVAGQPGQMVGLVPGNLSWTPMKNWFPEETSKFLIDDRLIIFRKGKRNVRIVELVSDEEWRESGKIYAGQPFTGKVRQMREQLKSEAEESGEALPRGALRQALSERYPEEDLTVANNPDIKLPSKQEVRQRARQQKNGSKFGGEGI
jgi:tyrosyl-tRNA synthetase